MSTEAILEVESTSSEDTFEIGKKLAGQLNDLRVVQMVGDLGAGKTTFIKGFAQGLGSADAVASPTFTVSREYTCANDVILHHFDFYRLDEPGIMADEIAEVLDDELAVVVIEWSDIIEDLLPESYLRVSLKPTEDPESRKIRIEKVVRR